MPLYAPTYVLGGTDVAVADGGTGASTAASARTNLEIIKRGLPNPSGGTMYGVPGVVFNNQNTQVVVADTIYYQPFLVTDEVTADAMTCEVTANAGTIARLGVVSADTAWQPVAVIKDFGTVSTTSNAVKTTGTSSTTLSPGRYLVAFVCDGAATFRVAQGNVPMGYLSAWSATMLSQRFSKASVGTGALGTTAWDTVTAGSASTQYFAALRLTAV